MDIIFRDGHTRTVESVPLFFIDLITPGDSCIAGGNLPEQVQAAASVSVIEFDTLLERVLKAGMTAPVL